MIWLVSQGVERVDVNAATVYMELTAADEAAKVGRWDIVRLLQDCGARYNPGLRDQVILRERRALQELHTTVNTNETQTLAPTSPSHEQQQEQQQQPQRKRPLGDVVVERTWCDLNKKKKYSDVAISVVEEEEEQEQDKENMCVVCMERPSKTAMVPCGHASFCEECAERLKSAVGKCAICRTEIQTVMNIYFS